MAAVIELSIVIPVFNSGSTITRVVEEIHAVFEGLEFEVLLVNDGSTDDSEQVCSALAERFNDTVSLVQLSRNFGEHNAVMAGLSHTSGLFVGVLDDDGQNPPSELARMHERLAETEVDVVYGRYVTKKHSWFRNLGSWLNGCMAHVLLGKPRDLYLSSFKVMRRSLVDDVLQYRGPLPYLDGLILRSTKRISQLDVVHLERLHGRSGYTLAKLMRLWFAMCLSGSLGNLFFHPQGAPQYVIRYVRSGGTCVET